MMKSFPMDRVPNLQSFPENGFPISAYYGVDSTIPDIQANSASSGDKNKSSLPPTDKKRLLITIVVIVLATYALFHWYNK